MVSDELMFPHYLVTQSSSEEKEVSRFCCIKKSRYSPSLPRVSNHLYDREEYQCRAKTEADTLHSRKCSEKTS